MSEARGKRRRSRTKGRPAATKTSTRNTGSGSTGARAPRSRKRIALWTVAAVVAAFVLIQFVPYGRDHTSPAAANPFQWATPTSEAIAQRACYDCHSSDTNWWWAVKIAPFSWLAQHDISKARTIVNFSDWNGAMTTAQLRRAVTGNMPPLQYTLLHPNAKLSTAEQQTLLRGFQASLADNNGTGTPAPAATASAPVSSSAATAIINARCGSCHSAQPALHYRAASAAEAQSLIDAMVQQGASMSAAEAQTLVEYYTN